VPHGATHRPCGLQTFPDGHGVVAEHSEHTCVAALQPCAWNVGPSQRAQSPSAAHEDGQRGAHAPATHAWFGAHTLALVELQATQRLVVRSHAWWCASHAAQSLSDWHVTVGCPFPPAGHVVAGSTHVPYCVHVLPAGHPAIVAGSHATQRPDEVSQRLRENVQPAHSASLVHDSR
jgi:hypothetical protein